MARPHPAPKLFTPASPAEGMSMSRDLAPRAIAERVADSWDKGLSRRRICCPTPDTLSVSRSRRPLSYPRRDAPHQE
jgi:hypothetical protein